MTEAIIVHEVRTAERAIAFTFDDGPNPLYTPQVLDIFEEVGGKATFYMIGEQMELEPELVRAVNAQGHEIGNHTYSHPKLTTLTAEQLSDELYRTDRLIQELTGKTPRTFRPPYFDYNREVGELVASFGYGAAGCVNGEARDWEQPGAAHIVEATRRAMRSGSILLFHDGYGDRS